MKKDEKIFVTGHRGLVGSAILRRLESEGYSNLIKRTKEELDLRQQTKVEDFFKVERPSYVFLAAAKVGGILANKSYPAEFIYDNLQIETNVINACWRFGVKKLLFLGSSCIYPKFAPQPMKEDCLLAGKLEPTNEPYAIAKIAGILMCQSYNRQFGTNFISVMPTNLYGPNDNFDLVNSHVLPALIRKFHLAKLLKREDYRLIFKDLYIYGNLPSLSEEEIKEDKEFLIRHLSGFGVFADRVILWGSGQPKREFLHVDDLAEACIFLMKTYREDAIINIGTGEDIEIRELAFIIADIVGFSGRIDFDLSKPDGTPRKLLNVDKIHSLGWRHQKDLNQGIKETYEWYQSQLEKD